jgi:hypothetical protein
MLRYFTACHLLRPLGRDAARSRLLSASGSQNSNAAAPENAASAAANADDAIAADTPTIVSATVPAANELSRYSRELVRQRPSTRTSAPVLRTKRIVVDDDDSWGPRCDGSLLECSLCFNSSIVSPDASVRRRYLHSHLITSLPTPLHSPTALPVGVSDASPSNAATAGAAPSQQAPLVEVKAVSRAEVQNTIAEALEAARRNAEAAPSDPRLRHGKEKQGAVFCKQMPRVHDVHIPHFLSSESPRPQIIAQMPTCTGPSSAHTKTLAAISSKCRRRTKTRHSTRLIVPSSTRWPKVRVWFLIVIVAQT